MLKTFDYVKLEAISRDNKLSKLALMKGAKDLILDFIPFLIAENVQIGKTTYVFVISEEMTLQKSIEIT